jgi:WhiB family transcriptional regulator, redox-sensing transcriptional regulator
MGGCTPADGSTSSAAERGRVDPYPLVVRPLSAPRAAEPVVDLRERPHAVPLGECAATAWECAIDYLRDFVAAGAIFAGNELVSQTIKPFNRHRGADHEQMRRVLDCLDAGRPVAFYGWWPTAELATTTEILGVDAMEVPPPDRKRSGLADGHAVVIVGYGRHAAFPGGGYLIVRNGWGGRGWGDAGDGYMPFTYLRSYATELCTYRLADGPRRVRDGDGPSDVDRPAAGSVRLPGVTPRDAVDAEIDASARCADPRASLTHLFFSEDPMELARARAICSTCTVRTLCLARALERREPYGVWGGELLLEGVVVPDKRGRGRPPKVPRPRLVVDEITGIPIVA